PVPSITPPSSAVAGSAANFTASATDPSTADSKAGFSYAWDFGDGGTGSGASVSHTYAKAGTYTVKLTATDKDNGSGSISSALTVGTPTPLMSIDFGTPNSSLAAGYTQVTEGTTYSAALGYGWQSGVIDSRDRGCGSDLTRDFNFT